MVRGRHVSSVSILAVAGAVTAFAVGTSLGAGAGPGSGLFVVSRGGGKAKKVVSSCVESFAWSPDGNSIAFVRLINDKAPQAETEVLNLKSDRTTLIANGGRGEPHAWSPDGSKIAFGGDDGLYAG